MREVVVCQVTAEEQARRAEERTTRYREIEEASRMNGDENPLLYAARVSAIHRIPTTTRRGGPPEEMDFGG